jgi:hypothetical protein
MQEAPSIIVSRPMPVNVLKGALAKTLLSEFEPDESTERSVAA